VRVVVGVADIARVGVLPGNVAPVGVAVPLEIIVMVEVGVSFGLGSMVGVAVSLGKDVD
jgi:hypothetical protein